MTGSARRPVDHALLQQVVSTLRLRLNLAFYYIETDNQLVVNVVDLRDSLPTLVQTWTFELTPIIASSATLRYLDGEIDIGTYAPSFETCPKPSIVRLDPDNVN